MRLLLVEDARLIREPLSRALELAGWEVEAVPDGDAALARLAVAPVLMFTKNWSEGTAVENLDQRSSRRPSHGIQRGAEKERPRDIHQVRP